MALFHIEVAVGRHAAAGYAFADRLGDFFIVNKYLGNSQKIIYQFIGPEVEQLRYREVIRQCPNCR